MQFCIRLYFCIKNAFGLIVQPQQVSRERRDRQTQGNRSDVCDFPRLPLHVALVCGNWARLNLVKVEATLGLCNFHEKIFIFLNLCVNIVLKKKNIRYVYIRCTFRLKILILSLLLITDIVILSLQFPYHVQNLPCNDIVSVIKGYRINIIQNKY